MLGAPRGPCGSLSRGRRTDRTAEFSVQPFILSRYPRPGRRIRAASCTAVQLHSPCTAGKVYPDPDWSSRSTSLAIHRREGVSGPRVVQPSIFTRYPRPGRRIRAASCPGVYLHSPCTAGKEFPDRERSSRPSSIAIRGQEGVSGPRVVQPSIFTRYPRPGRRIRAASCPGAYRHSLSAARKAYPDPDWSSRSTSLAIHRREGVSGPRVVQPFIFTRYPPPGRRFRAPSGPAVHLHSPCTAGKEFPDRERSSRLSSLAIRRQEGASGPRVVQPFIFTRVPPPGRRIRTARGPAVHLLRYPPSGRRIRTARGQLSFLTRSSAVRMTRSDRGWSCRSRQFACLPPGSRIRFAYAFSRSS